MILGRDEKRNFIRMEVDSKMSFQRNGSDESHDGLTKDLSATGLRFTTQTRVDEGEVLNITVYPGASVTPPLEAKLTVIRVTPNVETDLFEVAGTLEQH